MTEILKCPYCNEDLKEWDGRFYCANAMCPAKQEYLPKFIWQALIDGKKAQEALKKARDMYKKTLIDYIRVLYSIAPDFIDKHIYEEMFKYDKEIAFIIKQEKIKC